MNSTYSAQAISRALGTFNEAARVTFWERLREESEVETERLIVDPVERATVVTLREVAEALGKEYNTVMRWAERRPTSHFPNPVGRTLSTGRGRHAHAFDRGEVRSWLLTKKGLDLPG